MKGRSLFFRLLLPLLWLPTALLAWRYPGDEYLLFLLVNGLPGAWLPLVLGPIKPSEGLPLLLGAGMVSITAAGWLMDRLSVNRRFWFTLYAAGTIVLPFLMVTGYPSYQHALAKNGSLLSYLSASMNLSLYGASLVGTIVTMSAIGISRAWEQRASPTAGR